MLNTGSSLICLSLVIFLSIINGNSAAVNGGWNCLSCTIVLSDVEHLSILYNESIIQSLDRFCNYLPSEFKAFCKEAVDFLGKFLI
jgi:hypothetical protein